MSNLKSKYSKKATNEYLSKMLKQEEPKTEDLISNFDFYKYVDKDLNIIESDKIHEFSKKKIFDNKYKGSVILINNDSGNHWVLLLKRGKTIEFFDSYGVPFEESEISSLADTLDLKKVESNRVQFQKYSANINTCGKHVLFRLMTHLEFDMDLKKNNEFMKKMCKNFKNTPDEIVCIFVTDV